MKCDVKHVVILLGLFKRCCNSNIANPFWWLEDPQIKVALHGVTQNENYWTVIDAPWTVQLWKLALRMKHINQVCNRSKWCLLFTSLLNFHHSLRSLQYVKSSAFVKIGMLIIPILYILLYLTAFYISISHFKEKWCSRLWYLHEMLWFCCCHLPLVVRCWVELFSFNVATCKRVQLWEVVAPHLVLLT